MILWISLLMSQEWPMHAGGRRLLHLPSEKKETEEMSEPRELMEHQEREGRVWHHALGATAQTNELSLLG